MDTLSWALEYIGKGWSVLPLHSVQDGACTCDKGSNCPNGILAKHPMASLVPRGKEDASRDQAGYPAGDSST